MEFPHLHISTFRLVEMWKSGNYTFPNFDIIDKTVGIRECRSSTFPYPLLFWNQPKGPIKKTCMDCLDESVYMVLGNAHDPP